MNRYQAELSKRQAQDLLRHRRVLNSSMDAITEVDGQKVLNFCSNNYLGLANHPAVITAFQQAASEVGVGAGCASLVGGYHYYHQALEEALAAFLNRPRVLLFNSGYMQNIGILSALLTRHACVFADRKVHASLIDGVRLSQAKLYRYKHNDLQHLNGLIAQAKRCDFIVSDYVFSMDGDLAEIEALKQIAKTQQAMLMIDDAHGFGVLGAKGRGVLDQDEELPLVTATLGKALGVYGGFVSGENDLIEYMLQTARSYIYTTACPPAVACAALKALDVMQNEPWRREQLQQNIQYFKATAKALNIPLQHSDTPIQPLIIGSAKKAVHISDLLFQKGYNITAIRPPTVEKNHSRLRITLTANHTKAQIEALLSALKLSISEHEIEL